MVCVGRHVTEVCCLLLSEPTSDLEYCSLLLWEGSTLHWGSKAHLGFITTQTSQRLSSPDGKLGQESWEPAEG